ncbi:hypothetical protein H1R20_g14704, partial [Candolleomyces eurysporus]
MSAQLKDVLLVGFGAVGAVSDSLILKRSNLARVTIVARSNYDLVDREGLHFVSGKYGDIRGWKPDRICKSISEAADRPYSYVLVATKAVPELTRTPKLLEPLLSAPYTENYEQPTYVLLQNGLNVEVDLYKAAKALGQGTPKIVSAAVWIFTNLSAPNVVKHGDFERVTLGIYREDRTAIQNTPLEQSILEDIGGILTAGGSEVTIVPEIQRQKFAKNFWNVAFSSYATLTGHTVPALFRPPPKDPSVSYRPYVSPITAESIETYTVPSIKAVMTELLTLGRALGYPDNENGLPSALPDLVIEGTRKTHAQPNNSHKPSMMLDAERGQPLEVEVFSYSIFRPGPVTIDARLRDTSQDAVVASLNSLSIASNDLPVRPGFGTAGRAIKLRANFFPVQVPKGPLHEYDVAITPKAKELAKRIKRRIFQLAEATPEWTNKGLKGIVAHDHSAKLIAAKLLPQPLTIEVLYYDENEEPPKKGGKYYTLEINYVQPLDTGNLLNYLAGQSQYRDYDIMPIVSALNLVLGAHPNRSDGPGVMVGRNRWFFKAPGEQPTDLGAGLEAWKGFYSSVRPSHNQLMVNVNVCTTAFYIPGNLADAMTNFRNASFGARPAAFVKGVRVQTVHLGYRRTVKTLSNKTARTHRFKVQEYEDREMSVEEYFKRKYNRTLKYPDMPLVDVGGAKQNFLPAELCEILPNQAFKGKLLDDQTAQMIRVAAKPPNVNANMIVGQGIRELGFTGDSVAVKAFGASVGNEMAVVPGRILGRPDVQYANSTASVDERASWNMRNVKFTKGAKLDNWAVMLIFDGNPRDEFQGPQDPGVEQIWRGFASMCKASGMTVGPAPPRIIPVRLPKKDYNDPTRNAAMGAISDALKAGNKPSIALVVLSNGDKHVYSGIKKLCDTVLDLRQLQYFANVALKFNMKLGGVNHQLDKESMAWLKQRPTMIVGIDVTHPGPGSVRGTPSIAAVVASCDPFYAQFPCSMEIQESKKEMVTNLDRMMFQRLNLFLSRNKVLPERILIYRDGVSEGQFKIVIEEELPKIREAVRKFDQATKKYTPVITIVVCGKRHHTRFYPTEAGDGDQNGNPKPGTVVDRGVTAIYHFDFFLQAHGGLQGTTRPTHYYVVHDEIGFQPDPLQKLTNAVSYMFARATKAVSLASPAYYADLACERGRCYLHKLLQGVRAEGTKAGTENPEDVFREAEALWNNGVSGPALRDTMFYL